MFSRNEKCIRIRYKEVGKFFRFTNKVKLGGKRIKEKLVGKKHIFNDSYACRVSFSDFMG